MIVVRTGIDIPAAPMAVWSVLVDFAAYEEWNPFIVRASGEPESARSWI